MSKLFLASNHCSFSCTSFAGNPLHLSLHFQMFTDLQPCPHLQLLDFKAMRWHVAGLATEESLSHRSATDTWAGIGAHREGLLRQCSCQCGAVVGKRQRDAVISLLHQQLLYSLQLVVGQENTCVWRVGYWDGEKCCKKLLFMGSEYGSRGLMLGGQIPDVLYRCSVI